jgi:EpsI family protein
MTTSRLFILLAVLLAGLSAVFLIPEKVGLQASGINRELPEYLGEWWGREVDVTQKERDTLGSDTEFARKVYSNGLGAHVLTSIVLAGQDMMMAIHRPERCLAAQGWTFGPPSRRSIQLSNGKRLDVMRVQNTKTVKGADDQPVQIQNVCYYWFAGSSDVTPSHLQRVWFDSRDRLMEGTVQRWAMMMVSSDITAAHDKFGRDEKATDELLASFVQKLVPHIHRDSLVYH